jgi:uncharacterized protein DUF4349/putative zinc finger protein
MTAETHPIEKEKVMAYLDGELLPDEAARVAMHLDQCAACAELASELRGVSSRLLAWNVEPAPKQLSDAVLTAVKKNDAAGQIGKEQRKTAPNFVRTKLIHSRWTWAAAAVSVVVLSIVGFEWKSFRRSGMSEAVASREAESLALERYAISNNLEKDSRNEYASASPAPPPAGQPPPPPQKAEAPSIGPQIARTGTLNVSAKDFNAARASMDRIVKAHQGYISSLNVSTEQGAPRSLDAKIAVPAAQYDPTLADLRALGRVGQEQQSSEEVTSQIVDLDARLKNARETEAQLTEILRARAGKIGDVLVVEKEMARVRGEIEVMEADQKQLHDRVAFASIELNLAEEYEARHGDAPMSVARRIRNAVVDGYHIAADGLLGVCVFLLNIGPTLLVWCLILFWPARWAWRRWRISKTEKLAEG